jgi:hypothetical protein
MVGRRIGMMTGLALLTQSPRRSSSGTAIEGSSNAIELCEVFMRLRVNRCFRFQVGVNALVVFFFAVACSAKSSSLRWVEDVRLPDQRVVALTREQRFDEGDVVSSYWFEFRHPDTGESVRYENAREFRTVALYVHEKFVHLVVRPTFATHFDNAGCPNPPYFVFRYQDKQWAQVPLMQTPLKQVAENMTVDPKSVRDEIKKRGYVIRVDQIVPMSQSVGPAHYQYDLTKISAQTFACQERKRNPRT